MTTANQETAPTFMYFVNDGVYGSFNCILYDHITPTPFIVKVITIAYCAVTIGCEVYVMCSPVQFARRKPLFQDNWKASLLHV